MSKPGRSAQPSERSQVRPQNSQQELQRKHAQLQLLLEINNSLASNLHLKDLFAAITVSLRRVLKHDFSQVMLYDPSSGQLKTHACYFPNGKGLVHEGLLAPLEGTPAGQVFRTRKPMLMRRPDKVREPNAFVDRLLKEGVRSGCCVPLISHDRVLGVLSVGSFREAAFSEADQELMMAIANQFALATESALSHEALRTSQEELRNGGDRLQLLLEINNVLVAKRDIRELFAAISATLRRLTRHDYSQIVLRDPSSGQLVVRALDFPKGKGRIHEGLLVPLMGTPVGKVYQERQPLLVARLQRGEFPSEITDCLLAEGVRSICLAPLISHDQTLGVLSVGSSHEAAFSSAEADLLTSVAKQIAIAIENALAFEQIADLNNRLAQQNLYLEEAVRTEAGFEEIIGESPALRDVLRRAELAAPTGATVLITGETGTGKELIARAIHNLSPRHDRAFVKLNCAAIPAGLLESELFGHERGAFTGALARKVGRLELADGGTLFLDEIGDLPLDIQPKLLRALQEKTFERLGSTRSIRVDVRLVAATNRDLERMKAEGQFREDLYYRLNVVPIAMPPLRDRADDIPVLLHYFVQKHARLMNRKIDTIPADTMRALGSYCWPGNVRELENLVERSMILSPGPVLNVPVAELTKVRSPEPGDLATLEAAEREHIIRALKASNWVVGGPHGAAAKLDIKRTTLHAKMVKLGISIRKHV